MGASDYQFLMDNYIEKRFFLKGRIAIVTNISEKFGAMISEELALSGAITYSLGTSLHPKWQLIENEYYVNCNVSNISEFQLLCQ